MAGRTMRGRGAMLAVVLALAACTGGQSAPVNTVPGVSPSLAWQITQTPTSLVLGLQDRRAFYRLTGATLRGPGGQVVPAREISRNETDRVGVGGPYGGVGVGVGGGSRSGVGIGLSFPILGGGGSTRDRRETEVIFAVPDNGAGLAGWPADWVIDLALEDNDGTTSSATIAVPAATP